jgi:hypothetical protein
VKSKDFQEMGIQGAEILLDLLIRLNSLQYLDAPFRRRVDLLHEYLWDFCVSEELQNIQVEIPMLVPKSMNQLFHQAVRLAQCRQDALSRPVR